MNTQLQKLIERLKYQKEKAEADFKKTEFGSKEEGYHFGKVHAFSFAIEAADKILNEGSVAASVETHPSDCLCQLCIS